jgi:hypothetical protein
VTKVYKSANEGWIPAEWVKASNSEGNPTSAKFIDATPASGESAPPTSLSIQGVQLQADGSSTALLFGTDYTVQFNDGTITLTDAGVTKVNTDGGDVQARYSYSGNFTPWSLTPPAGTNLFEHLINLRRAVGRAKTSINDRNYMANFMAQHVDTDDLLTNGPQFTRDGGNPSDVLDRMNNIARYSGLMPIKTTAIPKDYIIIAMKGSVLHKVQTPWMMHGPEVNENTGNHTYLAQQFSASDMPKNDKIAIVGITNRNSE